jgi:general stress protein 26
MIANKLNTIAFELLTKSSYLTLGIIDSQGVWCSPLWFAYEHGNLYFVSSIESRHAKAINYNPKVSVSIFSNPTDVEDVKGIQMTGICETVTGINNIRSAIKIIFIKKGSEFFLLRSKKALSTSLYINSEFRIYKIKIIEIFVLNTDIIKKDVREKIQISEIL